MLAGDGNSRLQVGAGKSKPVGAVGDPPCSDAGRDCRGDRPPERKGEVGDKAEGSPGEPEDFALHEFILARDIE